MFNRSGFSFAPNKVIRALKDYDMSVQYHLLKSNVVVDALSLVSVGSVSHVE